MDVGAEKIRRQRVLTLVEIVPVPAGRWRVVKGRSYLQGDDGSHVCDRRGGGDSDIRVLNIALNSAA